MAQDGDSKIIKPNLIKFGHHKYYDMKKNILKCRLSQKVDDPLENFWMKVNVRLYDELL